MAWRSRRWSSNRPLSPAAMGRFKIENIDHRSVRKHADDKFKRPICMCVLDDPVQTAECQHLFCEPCLSAAGVEACPTCREAFPAGGPG